MSARGASGAWRLEWEPWASGILAVAWLGSFGLLGGGSARAEERASPLLVAFDFEGDTVETGPYTLTAYEGARGSVRLTTRYRMSGFRSVEVRAAAGDGRFAELQGFFREMPAGRLRVRFALLVAEPEEPMNVALAGESHFRLKKHGIGFWLKARSGSFYHVTDGRDVELFPIRALTWYLVEVVYDIDRGLYDLTIHAEGEQRPVVALTAQPNAVGRPGSRLHKFSFIGDPPGIDTSNTVFYVDDLFITADRPLPAPGPFVAPGRRLLFVDLDDYYRSLLYERPGCLPALSPEDFGLTDLDIEELAQLGAIGLYDDLADRRASAPPAVELPPRLRTRLGAMGLWGEGCGAPAGCGEPCARRLFEAAGHEVPEAKLYPMAQVMALAAEKRWREADALYLSIYPAWPADPRFAAVSALLGLARGDLAEAEAWLRTAVEDLPLSYRHPAIRRLWAGEIDQSLARELRTAFPADWPSYVETALTAEHRYYVLLWQGSLEPARSYAERMLARYRALELPAGAWLERQGDVLFRLGDYEGARRAYEASVGERKDPQPVFIKLSDVHFKLGDVEGERRYREKVYGSLRE